MYKVFLTPSGFEGPPGGPGGGRFVGEGDG